MERLEFERIVIGDLGINFHTGGFKDFRGIGRVTRELYANLKKRETADLPFYRKKEINFYSSVHWCPDLLPDNSVVLVHDVIPLIMPERFSHVSSEWKRYTKIARQADLIFTISQTSANDISRCLRIPEDRIEVVYNGVNNISDYDESSNLEKKNQVVFVGACDFHKNLKVVIDAMNNGMSNEIRLVLAGNGDMFKRFLAESGAANRDNIMIVDRPTDQEMANVIMESKAMVFPSLYEGFGLPPFEAAKLGVPAICSKIPVMKELLGDGAIFASHDDPYDWAMKINMVCDKPSYSEAVVKRAKAIADGFTWDNTTLRMINFLRSYIYF
ncbi:MAG: glycosyltransferase family 4 protein [Gibbsiella quercinecans]|uniref:glycosyltransferase family 4 protein n=1 Tax=Gibbsiella quercinecans TaxID=929813 RepID=UPI003F4062B9